MGAVGLHSATTYGLVGKININKQKIIIKSNRYKITNKINEIYVIDFIGYFILL